MRIFQRLAGLALFGLALWLTGTPPAVAEQTAQSPAETFPTSLHATRAGKHHWYGKEAGGFESMTGIRYEALACRNCHAKTLADGTPVDPARYRPSCRDCHATPGDRPEQAVCLGCHSRQKAEMQMHTDVHRAAGLNCMDCHTAREMHGDGIRYVSMLQPGATDAACTDCHEQPVGLMAHDIHRAAVDCKACHTRSVIACNNCHFESEVAGGGKRFPKPPLSGFLFLVRRAGSDKVHPATMQTLVHRGRTFAAIGPFTPHTVMETPRPCESCHESPALAEYRETGRITITRYNPRTGRIEGPAGVVPVPPNWREALTMDFVTYDGDPGDPDTDPHAWRFLKRGLDGAQMLFAEPLTERQLRRLEKY